MNLYLELLDCIDSIEDIAFVQCAKGSIPIDRFLELAKGTEYDDGYGAAEVATDLVIKLKNGNWLTREEYDGSEWFREHTTPIQQPLVNFEIHSLVARNIGWETLGEINHE